jgi:hypothetical protein
MSVPSTYISHQDLLDKNIIQEFYPVNDIFSAEKWIKEDIIDYYSNDFRIHIIRTDETNKEYIESACKTFNIKFKNHTSNDRINHEDLVDIFDNISNHLVIAIKGFFRRANLIPNEWKMKIGAMHEKHVINYDTNVQIQGLVGRMTGYWKSNIESGHKTGPYRTSIDSIKEYEKFYNDPIKLDNKYRTNNKISFVNPKHITNLESISQQVNKNTRVPIMIDVLESDYKIFEKTNKKDKEKRIKQIIENDKIRYKKIYDYIMNENVFCIEITKPQTEKSKGKNIYRFKNSIENKTSTSDAFKETHKNKNSWKAYLDDTNKKIYIIVWVLDESLYTLD